MNMALKLIVIAGIAAVFCPGCTAEAPAGASSAGSDPARKTVPATEAPKTLDAAIALAKAEGKNVLVEYTSTNCPYCRQMDSQTMAKADVRKALAEDVVYFRAVQEKNRSEFTAKFGERPTPSYAVISGSGETLHGPVSGVIPAANFTAYLAWAKKGEGSVPALTPGGS